MKKCEKCGEDLFESANPNEPWKGHKCEWDWKLDSNVLNLKKPSNVLSLLLLVFSIIVNILFGILTPVSIIFSLLALALCIQFIPVDNEFRGRLNSTLEVISVAIAIGALIITSNALNIAQKDFARTIELDQNTQEGLYSSLNFKLSFTEALSLSVLNNTRGIKSDENRLETNFPTDFESYVQEMRITDENLIRHLISLENYSKQVNLLIQNEPLNDGILHDIESLHRNSCLSKRELMKSINKSDLYKTIQISGKVIDVERLQCN